jgi:hypothetical protein
MKDFGMCKEAPLMNRLAWIVPLALLASAPAFSWCVDHDADDAKYCKEHPRPKCDGDADDKHVAACRSDSGGTHRTHGAHGVPEPDSLPLMLLGLGSSLVFIRRRRK